MPNPVRKVAALLGVVVALASGDALAHSTKERTVPPDGATLADPPAVIAMEFGSPIRITLISMTAADGEAVGFVSTTAPVPVTRFEATPPVLAPGDYTVTWRGLAEDGHPMQGSFGFTVE